MFAPLANATLKKIEIANGDHVLDVACGTGIIARTIRDQYAPDVQVSGLDINDMMLAKAQALSYNLPGQIEWYISDVTDIPVVSNAFSHVFCQQGLQYFPDDVAALTEMYRVLSVGGKLALTVWGPANEYFLAQSAAMKKYVGAQAGEKALEPFSYPATIRVPELLARLGFKDVTVGTVSIERVIRDAETGVREDILGSPLGSMVENIEPCVMDAVVRDVTSACTEYLQNGDLIIAQKSALITASAC